MSANVLIPTAGVLSLGSGPLDITCQVQDARIVSTTPNITVQTLCGASVTANTALTARTLDITFLQDWRSSGVSKYLHDHHGQTAAFVWTPSTDGTPSATGTVQIIEGSFGGAAGVPADDRVSLPIVGTVTYTADA